MTLKNSIGKLDAYYDRLKAKKVDKIKLKHVQKVLDKLKAKQLSLQDELQSAKKAAKKARLQGKLEIVGEQIKRGQWLMRALEQASDPE